MFFSFVQLKKSKCYDKFKTKQSRIKKKPMRGGFNKDGVFLKEWERLTGLIARCRARPLMTEWCAR